MKTEEFLRFLMQMKQGAVAQRLVFVWSGSKQALDQYLEGLEIHRCDLISIRAESFSPEPNYKKLLEAYLTAECRKYSDIRKEPSALVIEDAILLARYGCDMSILFSYGISPRSAVILLFPSELHRQLPARTGGWIRRNTAAVIQRISRQLGEPKCIVETSGG